MDEDTKAGVKDTAAYRISRQIMDHMYGSDEKMSNKDFVGLYADFHRRGGSWKAIMEGDMRSVKHIEDSIECLVKSRNTGKIAAIVSSRFVV
jgi:hypothetical protein